MKKIIILLLVLLGLSINTYALNLPNLKPAQKEEEMDSVSQQARILYAQNQIDEALKLLTTKGEATRSCEDWLLMGNIMQDKNELDKAIFLYNKAILKDPKYYKSYYNLGYIYLIQDKPNLALFNFKKAVKYKDDFSYGYYNMGCAYLKLKQYRNARYNFFRALDTNPKEPMIYYNLAYTFKMLNNKKQAKSYLDLYNKMTEGQ